MTESSGYQNILCIRADNMGDVIMSVPAMRALKSTFGSRITLLTSRAGSLVFPWLTDVDECITADLPWVKTMSDTIVDLPELAGTLASRHFDAAVIFTVYSQSALPSAMLAYMAGIPVRVAYARENPYDLLTAWVPDVEPYELINHQVERDLNLVKALGAKPMDTHLTLRRDPKNISTVKEKLADILAVASSPYLILHPGVSEEKRKYPAELWAEAGKMLIGKFDLPLLITGSSAESELAGLIAEAIGTGAYAVAGRFSLGEFIELVASAACVISVNTSTIHIAAATQTPVVVLYAETNPQHTPWQSPHRILPFSVLAHLASRNPIIRDVARRFYSNLIPYPEPARIVDAVSELMQVSAPASRD